MDDLVRELLPWMGVVGLIGAGWTFRGWHDTRKRRNAAKKARS